jgi:hypothetical protein
LASCLPRQAQQANMGKNGWQKVFLHAPPAHQQ